MKKIRKPVKQIVIGTYQSIKAASKQVDLFFRLVVQAAFGGKGV